MGRLITRWDISKPILETLVKEAEKNLGQLEDHIFGQVCDEYGVDEEIVMEQMVESGDYEFFRYPQGWSVERL